MPKRHVLLLGAGFSRNWGGWLASEAFEYLLGVPSIVASRSLRDLLWDHQPKGGFESALQELQDAYRSDNRGHRDNLQILESAIEDMFRAMNESFGSATWEFSNGLPGKTVSAFLSRFDAIYTLNQDLLLEYHYAPSVRAPDIRFPRRWKGVQFPGVRTTRVRFGKSVLQKVGTFRMSTEGSKVTLQSDRQPIFKLHGSSNWFEDGGGRLLVVGGAKASQISRNPLLSEYANRFETEIAGGSSRLMVIGYGFRDAHINRVLDDGAARGLESFIIDPAGSDAARNQNPTRKAGQIGAETTIEQFFARSLIGASRRGLREIFAGDGPEFDKVMRFFDS